MKQKTKSESEGSGSSAPVYAYYQFAGVADRAALSPAAPGPETVFRCKHCGKRMTLRETTNYYGIPACPVCVNAGAPFEVVPEGQ